MTEQTRAKRSPQQADETDARSVQVRPRRKRCAQQTRQEILRAAARRFASSGYASVTLKEVAADAGVTAALVVRYFGSKHDLFREIVRDPTTAHADEVVLTGPLETLGRRLAESIAADWLTPELAYAPIAALRSLDVADAKALLATETERRFTKPLAGVLPGPNPQVRAKVIVSQMWALGLFALGALLEPEGGPLSAEEINEITRLFGAAIQACITAE